MTHTVHEYNHGGVCIFCGYSQVGWYCKKCKTNHFGNCPKMKVAFTSSNTPILEDSKHDTPKLDIKLWYKCGFCDKPFLTCSACARHIERKSIGGICFPSDINIMQKPEKLRKG